MKRCLIIFAKEPLRGKVKTRIAKHFGVEKSVYLYKAFLEDTLNIAREIETEQKVLAFESDENPEFLKKIAKDFIFYKQEGQDLGTKIQKAFLYAKNSGCTSTIIMGSDSPTLPIEYIQQAFLHLNKKDFVLGPTLDGGYYLIGSKGTCDNIFKDVKWSTDSVLKKTLSNIRALKLKVVLLDKWYDIDTYEDVLYLKQKLDETENEAAVLTKSMIYRLISEK